MLYTSCQLPVLIPVIVDIPSDKSYFWNEIGNVSLGSKALLYHHPDIRPRILQRQFRTTDAGRDHWRYQFFDTLLVDARISPCHDATIHNPQNSRFAIIDRQKYRMLSPPERARMSSRPFCS